GEVDTHRIANVPRSQRTFPQAVHRRFVDNRSTDRPPFGPDLRGGPTFSTISMKTLSGLLDHSAHSREVSNEPPSVPCLELPLPALTTLARRFGRLLTHPLLSRWPSQTGTDEDDRGHYRRSPHGVGHLVNPGRR